MVLKVLLLDYFTDWDLQKKLALMDATDIYIHRNIGLTIIEHLQNEKKQH